MSSFGNLHSGVEYHCKDAINGNLLVAINVRNDGGAIEGIDGMVVVEHYPANIVFEVGGALVLDRVWSV